MASLNNIRKRIIAIKKTSKITQAMRLVSTVKIQQQKNRYANISKFMNSLYNLLRDLAKSSKYENVFDNKPKSNKKLYVIITSTLGLCGSFNVNITKQLLSVLKNNDDIYVVGNQGFNYLKNQQYANQIKASFNFDSQNLDYLELYPITQTIINDFKQGDYSEIHIVYTKYLNPLKFVPTDLKVLPIERSLFSTRDIEENIINELNDEGKVIEVESKRSEIICNLIPFFFDSLLVSSIIESQLCEYSARRNAMETATDNANDLIEELKTTYNQLRQNKITQEITEIIAGASE